MGDGRKKVVQTFERIGSQVERCTGQGRKNGQKDKPRRWGWESRFNG